MKKNGGGHAREMMMETVVGLFIVLIFIGIGIFTIVLSKDYWFRDVYTIHARFDDVMGLREGDSVVVRGMQIGNVGEILLKTNEVIVTMQLESDIHIRKGYEIQIKPASVLGGQYLHIDQGPVNARELPHDSVFEGHTPPDLMMEAAELVGELRKRLFDGGIIDDLERTTHSFRIITERIEKGKGTLGKLMSEDDTLYADLSETLTSAKDIVARVEDGKGSLGKLLSEDSSLYDNLLAATETLSNLSTRLEGGQGTLGKLLAEDAELYNDLRATVKSLKSVAQKVERGEGLLGKLTSDDELAQELEEVVGEARATLDDFRESSPVVTFSSIFFGAF